MFKDEYESNNNNNIKPYQRSSKKVSVIQLSKDNKFIKEWDSISEAEYQLKLKNISTCCNGKYKYVGGFKWLYKYDYENIDNINEYFKVYDDKYIIQLTLDNIFIEEFESIVEVERKTGINSSSISACCRNKRNSAGGYRWLYKDDYNLNKNNLELLPKKKKKIVQLDLDNNLIKEYESIKEAEKQTGIASPNISRYCKGKVKATNGFKWMYKEDYIKYIEQQNKSA